MEKKKPRSVAKEGAKLRMDSPDQPGALAVGDGNGEGTAPARSPLGARFFDTQAGLSSSRQRLLRQIIDESNETFFLSSREMGRRYNVDTATIIRTVQALGYEKFADFAQDLRAHFVTQITPYSAMKAAEQSNRSVSDLVRQSVDQDLDNLSAFRSALDPDKIIEIAKQINQARRIVILGIDFAASLAGSLAYALVRLGFDADAPVGNADRGGIPIGEAIACREEPPGSGHARALDESRVDPFAQRHPDVIASAWLRDRGDPAA